MLVHLFRRSPTGFLLAAGLLTASGAVLRVKPGNTEASADSLCWTKAFPSPTPALAVARKGDEVWTRQGVVRVRSPCPPE
jgi:hypothetical protein